MPRFDWSETDLRLQALNTRLPAEARSLKNRHRWRRKWLADDLGEGGGGIWHYFPARDVSGVQLVICAHCESERSESMGSLPVFGCVAIPAPAVPHEPERNLPRVSGEVK